RDMIDVRKAASNRYPEVQSNVIAYRIEGPQGGELYFDFSRPDPEQIFAEGRPARFDMRYTYVDRLLQLVLDRKIDWDELNFSNQVSICQNKYTAHFYSMIREVGGLNSQT